MSARAVSRRSARTTSATVLSSRRASARGLRSSYTTTAAYSPARSRARTSPSAGRICSRLTAPLARRRTIVLQRTLRAPRMWPALCARKGRQSSTRQRPGPPAGAASSRHTRRRSALPSISRSPSVATMAAGGGGTLRPVPVAARAPPRARRSLYYPPAAAARPRPLAPPRPFIPRRGRMNGREAGARDVTASIHKKKNPGSPPAGHVLLGL